MKRARNTKGQCFVEMIVGGIVMVPLMLFGLDALTIGLSLSINDHLAKEAARIASVQLDEQSAKLAAAKVITGMRKSALLTDANIENFTYASKDRVAVKTELTVKMPAPFPFFEGTKIYSMAVEPITGNRVEYQEQK